MKELTPTKILPPNATDFEIDIISVITNRINRIYIDIQTLVNSKLKQTHKSLLPYVVQEFGFASVSKYIPDNDEFMAEGIKWKKSKGTPYAVKKALGWIFREDEYRENTKQWHWAVVEIRLSKDIPSLDIIKDIAFLVRESLPGRAQLLRIWSGVDYPMMILNESNLNESRLNVPGGDWDDDLKLWLYINNKADLAFPPLTLTFESFNAVLNTTTLTRSQRLNDQELLNFAEGPLCIFSAPTYTNNNTTLGPFKLSFARLIALNDDTNLADIVSHLGSY